VQRSWCRAPSTLALALLVFLLPFLSVSCDAPGGFGRVAQGGTTSDTGVELAILVAAAAGWVLALIGLLGARGDLIDRLETQLVEPFPDGKSAGDYVAIGPGFG